MPSVKTEVEVDVELDDFDDDEIRDEFKRRKLGDEAADWHEQDVRRLAEHIAAGEKDDALDLLNTMTEGAFNPRVVKMLAALTFVAAYAETTDTIPVTACVRLSAGNNCIVVEATNLESGATGKFVAEVGEPIGFDACCVPAAPLLKAVKGASAEIEFNLSAGTANVISGRKRVSLPFLLGSDFPEVGRINEVVCKFDLDGEELTDRLADVAFAQSNETTRFYLCGTAWTTVGDAIEFAATDGHVLATSMLTAKTGGLVQIIVPAFFKVPAWTGPVSIEVGTYAIALTSGDRRVFSKLIEGHFPDYRRIIIRDANRLLFDREELLSASRTSGIVADAKEHFVMLVGRDGTAEFIAQTKRGEAVDGAAYQGEDFQVALVQSNITEALESFDCETVELMWTDHMTPIVVRDPRDESRLAQIVACTHPRLANYLPQLQAA